MAERIATPLNFETPMCRRTALLGMGAAGVVALSACAASTTATAGAGTTAASTSAAPAPSSAAAASADTGGGNGLVALADVPVGGAVNAKDADGKPIIVAQPKAGEVVAFSATCTHRGGTVAAKTGVCPLHGSKFDPLTGKVLGGPAASPLLSVPVKLKGDQVVSA